MIRRSATYHLWNQLPVSLRQPLYADDVTLSNSSPTYSPLSCTLHMSTTHTRYFIPRSKLTFSTNRSLLAPTWTGLLELKLDRTHSAQRFFYFSLFLFLFIWGRAVD